MKYKEPVIVVPELEKLVGTYKSRYWSDKHERIVRWYYGQVPNEAIAKEVGRSPDAVRMKAKHMGLKMPGRN